MPDEPEPPDNVIIVSFGDPTRPEAKIADADRLRCRHRNYELVEARRAVRCGLCNAKLDAFDVLMQYARGERNWRWHEAEERDARKRTEVLLDEEKRIKARVRNASKRDAELALEQQRKQLAEMHRRVEWNARQIGELAGRIQRAVAPTRKRKQEGDAHE